MCFVERGQSIHINRSLEEADFNPHEWIGGVLRSSRLGEEVSADGGETAELGLKVEPEDGAALLQCHGRT